MKESVYEKLDLIIDQSQTPHEIFFETLQMECMERKYFQTKTVE
jgi:hypothetical protein